MELPAVAGAAKEVGRYDTVVKIDDSRSLGRAQRDVERCDLRIASRRRQHSINLEIERQRIHYIYAQTRAPKGRTSPRPVANLIGVGVEC